MKLWRSFILASLLLPSVAVSITNAAPTPMAGSQTIGTGMPTGPSPDAGGNLYTLAIYYFDPNGTQKTATVTVKDIPVTAGLPTPTRAQVEAASLAKAQAIADAINAANIAIQPAMLPGPTGAEATYKTMTAMVDAYTLLGMYPTGIVNQKLVKGVVVNVPVLAPASFFTVTVYGVSQKVLQPNTPGNPTPKAILGAAIYQTNGVTGEVGNLDFSFKQGSGPASMYQGTYNGSGANSGSSTGLDASGYDSVVGFGFIDETSATPVDYIAAFDPPPDLTDAQVLGDLAALFNEDYASDGYTATYDPEIDTLSIDQLLPAIDPVWSADSDTGLYFVASANSVSEPDSWLLMLLGFAGVGFAAYRNRRRCPPGTSA
jgi:hypothetical protein